jgi:glycerophosphoryl diester phosphodiesterase
MTLIGEDRSLVRRALVGVRAALAPRTVRHSRERPLVILGHRGMRDKQPENTVIACQAAIAAGAQGVEVDVCVTRDAKVVLWHDRDPADAISRARRRGADGTSFVPLVPADGKLRPVSELSLAELRESYGYARWGLPLVSGEPERVACVDSLEDFLRWLVEEPRAITAVMDVKLAPHELSGVRVLIKALERGFASHPRLLHKQLQLLCAEREVFHALRREIRHRALPGWDLTADFELPGVLQTARELGVRHVALGVTLRRSWSAVRKETIDAVRARARGELSSVLVWTVDEADQLADLDEIGVDSVIVGSELLAALGQTHLAGQSGVTST